jgi:hypothetical protein
VVRRSPAPRETEREMLVVPSSLSLSLSANRCCPRCPLAHPVLCPGTTSPASFLPLFSPPVPPCVCGCVCFLCAWKKSVCLPQSQTRRGRGRGRRRLSPSPVVPVHPGCQPAAAAPPRLPSSPPPGCRTIRVWSVVRLVDPAAPGPCPSRRRHHRRTHTTTTPLVLVGFVEGVSPSHM